MEKTHNFAYRPDIDGLRALAVVAVIIFHFAHTLLPGGFLGVDVFFVISGYLITGILVKEHENGGIRLTAFWIRRIRRLLPAFAVMAITTCGAAWAFMPYTLAEASAKQSIATCLAVSNWYLWKLTSDYWGQAAESAPLLHTWSLSVEEQFYLLFPFILWAGLRYGGRRVATLIMLVLTAIGFFYSLHLGGREQSQAFYFTTTRAWELLVGVSVALVARDLKEFFRHHVLKWAGLALILGSFVLVHGGDFVPATGALAAVLGTALVCLSDSSGWQGADWMTSRPVLYLGKVSYSLYLWHWPPLVFATVFGLAFPTYSFGQWGLAAGIVLGLASYHFIEPLGRWPRFLKVVAPALFVATISLAYLIFIQRSSREGPGVLTTPPELMSKASVYIIGDSHAEFLAPALERRLGEAGLIMASGASSGNALAPGTHLSSKLKMDEWNHVQAQRLEFIAKNRPAVLVIVCRWDKYTAKEDSHATLTAIKDYLLANPRMRIILLGQVPLYNCGEFSPAEWALWTKSIGAPLPGFRHTKLQSTASSVYRDMCRENGLLYLDTASTFASAVQGTSLKDGIHELYADDDHVSRKGATILAECVAQKIANLTQK